MPCLGVDTGASFRWMGLFQGADRLVMGRDWGEHTATNAGSTGNPLKERLQEECLQRAEP